MIKCKNGFKNNKNGNSYKKLASMGKLSVGIISKLHSPIDSTNRFINLALHSIDEDSQGRQFLLESKNGIRKTAQLVKKLNDYAKKLEKEIGYLIIKNEQK